MIGIAICRYLHPPLKTGLAPIALSAETAVLILFHEHYRTSEAVSFSWMFISQLQEPKYARF